MKRLAKEKISLSNFWGQCLLVTVGILGLIVGLLIFCFFTFKPVLTPGMVDLGEVPNNLEGQLLVARTFQQTIRRLPNEELIRVSYIMGDVSEFVQYHRKSKRLYHGNGRLYYHRTNELVKPEDLGCNYYRSEKDVHHTLDTIIKGHAGLHEFATHPLDILPDGEFCN